MLHANRFDLIRLCLASGVFAYHLVALASLDVQGPWESGLGVLAELCIQGFFIVSGALVYGSWERSKSLRDYFGKRVRRLYPAYLVVILVPALISFLLSGRGSEVLAYLGANLIFLNFLEPTLPGLFETNRFTVVNGALWTIKIEVMFYAALPLLAWALSKFQRHWITVLSCLALLSYLWSVVIPIWQHPLSAQLARQLPGQMMYFAAGMALWRYREAIKVRARSCLFFGLIALAIDLFVLDIHVLQVLGLAGVVAGLAYLPGPALNAARWGDVSYGVYIVHFPILQALISLEMFTRYGALTASLMAVLLVFGVSYLLWWWVEKPALRRDNHYRMASQD